MAPVGLRDRDRGTVTLSTSLGLPKKLIRVRENPEVAVAYHAREHSRLDRGQFVLVQGLASFDPKPDRRWLDSIAPEWEALPRPEADRRPRAVARRLLLAAGRDRDRGQAGALLADRRLRRRPRGLRRAASGSPTGAAERTAQRHRRPRVDQPPGPEHQPAPSHPAGLGGRRRPPRGRARGGYRSGRRGRRPGRGRRWADPAGRAPGRPDVARLQAPDDRPGAAGAHGLARRTRAAGSATRRTPRPGTRSPRPRPCSSSARRSPPGPVSARRAPPASPRNRRRRRRWSPSPPAARCSSAPSSGMDELAIEPRTSGGTAVGRARDASVAMLAPLGR